MPFELTNFLPVHRRSGFRKMHEKPSTIVQLQFVSYLGGDFHSTRQECSKCKFRFCALIKLSSNSLVLRSRRDALTELRGGGQPARVGQGREEETAASATDSLHQSTTAGEKKMKKRGKASAAACDEKCCISPVCS